MIDPHSDGLGVSMCIQKALEDAGISPKEVSVSDFLIKVYHMCRITTVSIFTGTFKG